MKKNLAGGGGGTCTTHVRDEKFLQSFSRKSEGKKVCGCERKYHFFRNCLDQGPTIASCFVRDKKHLNSVVLVCISAAEGLKVFAPCICCLATQ